MPQMLRRVRSETAVNPVRRSLGYKSLQASRLDAGGSANGWWVVEGSGEAYL